MHSQGLVGVCVPPSGGAEVCPHPQGGPEGAHRGSLPPPDQSWGPFLSVPPDAGLYCVSISVRDNQPVVGSLSPHPDVPRGTERWRALRLPVPTAGDCQFIFFCVFGGFVCPFFSFFFFSPTEMQTEAK